MAQGLVERDAELGVLLAATEAARAGAGALLVVEGPAGIGKSRLLQAHREHARAEGLAVLAARAGELERDVPYGVVRQLLERPLAAMDPERREAALAGAAALARPLVAPTPGEAPSADGGAAAVAHVLHGLYWLCANLAQGSALVLHVDDLQWADEPSLRFVDYLARRLEGLPVLLVAAVRTGEEAAEEPLVAGLLADPATRAVRPGPLGVEGVTAVVAAAYDGGPVEPAFAEACRAATAGNPFLLGELVAALRADGVAPEAKAARHVTELGPKTVSRAVLLRLARVDPAATALAKAAAVLGDGTSLAVAAEVAELDAAGAADAAGALAALHVLDDREPLAFAHPVVRASIYRDLPLGDRARMHARAAEVLRRGGARAEQVAHHLLAAPPAGAAWAVATLCDAARDAYAGGATASAAALLRRALDEPPAEEERGPVLADLGRAEASGGDLAGAATHLRAALEALPDPRDRARCFPDLGWALMATEGVPAALDAIEAEIDTTRPVDADLALKLEADLAAIGLLDPATAPRVHERLSALRPEMAGATRGERLVLASIAMVAWYPPEPAAAVADLCRRAWGDGALLGDTSIEDLPAYQVAYALVMADGAEEAERAAEAIVAAGRAAGSAIAFGAGSGVRAFARLRRGALQDAEADCAQSLAGLTQLGPLAHQMTMSFVAVRSGVEAMVARGELDGAQRVLDESGFGGELPDLVPFNRVLLSRALLRLAQGRPQEALDDARELGARDARAGIDNPADAWRLAAATALQRLGRAEEAAPLLDAQLELARRWGTASAIGLAEHARALAGPAAGRVEALRAAVATLEGSPDRAARAVARIDLGAALRAAGERRAAQEALAEGLELAEACGAPPAARRAHEELQTLGAKPRRLRFSGAEDLTASERRVAEMAAGGMSNREIAQALFVTAKTVENHLGRCYGKLGITSRRELAAALAG